jgi:hypothetical protein
VNIKFEFKWEVLCKWLVKTFKVSKLLFVDFEMGFEKVVQIFEAVQAKLK